MNWIDSWAETYSGLLLLCGLIVSLFIDAAIVSYTVIFLCGMIVGRLYHLRKHRLGFPFYLIVLGFLLGYMIGNYLNRRGFWLIILILFAVGCKFGDWLIHKKYCK